ncbi:MAG: hypothetical protein C0624_12485 [Desulfuromonas sp.]|nr:MAG: hypothetical protein C0624_12485 [Desulfuromonas sp.]
MKLIVQRLGAWGIGKMLFWRDLSLVASATALSLPRLFAPGNRSSRKVLLKQIYFTGFESLKIILPTSLFLGTAIIAQVIGLLGSTNISMIGKILIWTVLRELGPLLTAVIIVARSGAAVTAELGAMNVNREVLALETVGIDINEYLLLPRVLAFAFSAMFLTVYFELGAVLGGFLIANAFWNIPYEMFSQGIYAALDFREVLVSLLKGFVFGAVMSLICVQQGMSVGESSTMVPRAASRGVIASLFAIFMTNGIISLLAFY